ncbi:MAG: carboxypeptidase-like regulatory domain-containing protein, partial [Bacteroidales bacterium]
MQAVYDLNDVPANAGEDGGLVRFIPHSGLLIAMLLLTFSCQKDNGGNPPPEPENESRIEGRVIHSGQPLPGARVKIRATEICTVTGQDGLFRLNVPIQMETVTLTAWKEGYLIGGGQEYQPGDTGIMIVLEPFSMADNKNYRWVSAHSASGESLNCENCHSDPGSRAGLPFDQWKLDAHSGSATNLRFLTMYAGTDVNGNTSPATVYMNHPEYGPVPLPPDRAIPYFGPGYKLDFPETEGNCAACHAPMAAIDDPYGANPLELKGTELEGISCDFCHKIVEARLNPESGEPHQNMPGVLSYQFARPPEGHQLFTGPFDDVAPGEDTWSPLQKESRYCAPCHVGYFWGVRIYNSYGEWLESPYSDDSTGKTCQDCHMPVGSADRFATAEAGGCIRDPNGIGTHRMMGIRDESFMQNAVSMVASASSRDGRIDLHVEITNDNTGHHIPTDSPLRHLILVVRTSDSQGDTLRRLSGPVLPDWCGQGDKDEGYFAGLPGEVYARILREHWTEKEPTAAYWMQTMEVSDSRIKAFGTARA